MDRFLSEVIPQQVEAIDAVLYLNETGCLTCNRSYAALISQYTGVSNVLLVIDGYGSNVDISPFLEGQPNIILDRKKRFSALLPWKSSCAIFLSEQQVDTVITLDARTLSDQLAQIINRLAKVKA